ncbi:NADH:flavin oxidoreductase/NADH oxidase [Paracoccus sp. (in: a-proteobacteria)]|uniref:NADH:flavin oxidoreductase/NADH oxidase n=1 Tax=Paracoccus sp. TaxID=267 RepID=UPI002AFFF5D5|nr:NADH:flavin oxidoreductase/NADH oxidase [Paracoccus sp. (in: a-proteobacteria)]
MSETNNAPQGPKLLSEFSLRGVTLKNRMMVSPMCMYSAKDGFADDFHLVHLGRFALGGAGLVFVEATSVSSDGKITHGCLGLWKDEQIAQLTRIADFLHQSGAKAGIQLSHAGGKGSSQRPWEGLGPLSAADVEARGDAPWPVLSVTDTPLQQGQEGVRALSEADMDRIADDFAQAAKRADRAGFDIIEVHCAHGYLLHAFLSPISNLREDGFGGDLEGRMRFPLDVLQRVRAAWPESKPMSVRISSVDGVDVGWTIEDSVIFARRLAGIGVDIVDCSSGGMVLPREKNLPQRTPGFHLPYAEIIRREADIPVVGVGLIRDARQAEAAIAEGCADLVAVARELLFDPNWADRCALELTGAAGWDLWPEQFGWWLKRRARQQKDLFGPDREEG